MNTKRQPKGIPVGGQYAENSHDEAGSTLTSSFVGDTPFSLIAERDTLEQEYAKAAEQEYAAHFARAAEQYGGGDGSVRLEFDNEDGQVTVFSPDGEVIEDDSILDLLPAGYENGRIEVDYSGDRYVSTVVNSDTGDEESYEFVHSQGDIDALATAAQDATSHRATIRDSAEKVAVVSAYESARIVSDEENMTFTPTSLPLGDGAPTKVLRLPNGLSVAPLNAREADAYGFYGQNVESVTVERDGEGYLIHRTVRRPISGGTEVLTDRVTAGSRERWKAGEL